LRKRYAFVAGNDGDPPYPTQPEFAPFLGAQRIPRRKKNLA
jgi:hypothetical protein